MQHTTVLVFTNESDTACALTGYPDVSFLDATGRALKLEYRNSGDQMVTFQSARAVILPPGAQAFVAVNKYVCMSSTAAASSVDVTSPSVSGRVSLPSTGFVYADECSHPGDIGGTVHVSPFEPTLRDTLSH